MRKLVPVFCLVIFFQTLLAQDYLRKNEYFFSSMTGLKLFVVEDKTAQHTTIGLVFNFGGYSEDERYDGLSFLIEKVFAERLRKNLKENVTDTSFVRSHTETNGEFIFLGISCPPAQHKNAVMALYKSMITPVDSAETVHAVEISNRTSRQRSTSPADQLDSILGSLVWTDNFSKRMFISEWNDSTSRDLPERLNEMKEQHICPGNALLVIKGNVLAREINQAVIKMVERWKKCTAVGHEHLAGYNYKPTLTSSQFVFEDSLVLTPFYKVGIQGAAPFEGLKMKYCEDILLKILANPNSKLRSYLKDSCHLNLIHADNELKRQLNQITFTITTDSGFLAEGIACFRDLLTGEHDTLIDETDVEYGKKEIINEFYHTFSNNREHVYLIAQYWKGVSINAYDKFEDTVNAITMKDMRIYLDKYLHNRHSITGLAISPAMRKSTGIDSFFTSLPADIESFNFKFLKNSARFAGPAEDSIFNSLLQFLKLNPAMKVKINGMCHQDELLDVSDDQMLTWTRSLDHFIMNPPSLVKKKKFRLDVYRSLVVIKKLNEAGIDLERLFGTGNIVRSPENPEQFQMVSCSLSD